MSVGVEFYALKVAEYGDDVSRFAHVFKTDLLRGDVAGAKEILARLEHQAWLLSDHAKSALEKAT